jgi:hypothetical protein
MFPEGTIVLSSTQMSEFEGGLFYLIHTRLMCTGTYRLGGPPCPLLPVESLVQLANDWKLKP